MKPRGANTRSKLLCPDCGEVNRVSKINDGVLLLVCGHSRGEILPLLPGRVSIESLRSRTGQECFPLEKETNAIQHQH